MAAIWDSGIHGQCFSPHVTYLAGYIGFGKQCGQIQRIRADTSLRPRRFYGSRLRRHTNLCHLSATDERAHQDRALLPYGSWRLVGLLPLNFEEKTDFFPALQAVQSRKQFI